MRLFTIKLMLVFAGFILGLAVGKDLRKPAFPNDDSRCAFPGQLPIPSGTDGLKIKQVHSCGIIYFNNTFYTTAEGEQALELASQHCRDEFLKKRLDSK